MENKQSFSTKERIWESDQGLKKTSKTNIIIKMTDHINQGMAVLAGIALVAMAVLVVLNAILRMYIAPIPGTPEMVGWFAGITAIFSLGYAQLSKGHVFVDLLIIKFTDTWKKITHTLMNLLSMAFFLITGVIIILYGVQLLNNNTLSETLQFPFYPLVMLCSLGFVGLFLAILKETILIWRGMD
ncbi:TRAP transporter small permease [Salicibibacter cibarius]|uniref:TRAP transporter small permease n=1 Tax=Salicibibacter cibarius TaxID=2743000 RepID=A0A7T6YZV9_9BACI|nr:TRAP transporter small permease [Salicibibacter cibarius]QQK74383.1 TRAP transporter small permease [Salicibibacter cibarius]